MVEILQTAYVRFLRAFHSSLVNEPVRLARELSKVLALTRSSASARRSACDRFIAVPLQWVGDR